MLSDYDADIVLGCESHIDHSILSSEILPVTYKIIHKDRCLGGGVFIGYKDHLNVCEESSLILDAEMVWVKLYNSNKKPMYLCSFYRPPDSNMHPITQLSESLHKLCLNRAVPPTILLAGDFNLPSIPLVD